MLGLILGIIVAFALCAAIIAVLLWCAPDGYEDEYGFHLGEPPPFNREEPEDRDAA